MGKFLGPHLWYSCCRKIDVSTYRKTILYTAKKGPCIFKTFFSDAGWSETDEKSIFRYKYAGHVSHRVTYNGGIPVGRYARVSGIYAVLHALNSINQDVNRANL